MQRLVSLPPLSGLKQTDAATVPITAAEPNEAISATIAFGLHYLMCASASTLMLAKWTRCDTTEW